MNKSSLKNVEVELKLFEEIEKKKDHSQRTLSSELNIALGLSNALIKSFISKGFLKLSQAPMKRYFYYITPKGLVEKAKLTSEFLKSSFEFYNKIRNQYEKEFKKLNKVQTKKIILIGISEFTEIAILAAKINNITIDCILSKDYKKRLFCGIAVKKKLNKSSFENTKLFFICSARQGIQDYTSLIMKKNLIKPKSLLLD
tara:strand:- start:61057 stop:61656 length:600 start_codon:yes stop_codon:yes gene_type:complete